MIRLPGENLMFFFFFFWYSPLHFVELMPFANLDIETSNKDMSKIITATSASSLRFGQLKEYDYIDYLMNKGW